MPKAKRPTCQCGHSATSHPNAGPCIVSYGPPHTYVCNCERYSHGPDVYHRRREGDRHAQA